MTVSRQGGGICGCLLHCSPEKFPDYLSYPGIDLVEWRIDEFARKFKREQMAGFFEILSNSSRRTRRAKPARPTGEREGTIGGDLPGVGASRLPVIATNRPAREMGYFDGPEDMRLRILLDAAKAGAEWIDIEHDVGGIAFDGFRKAGAKVLLSWHDPNHTPSNRHLRSKLEKMSKTGAEALKIATLACSAEDNLRLLELIPFARKELGTDLVAFCMGPLGKWSRVACVVLGSPWTYARLRGQPEAAPGQLGAEEMQNILEKIF